MELFLTGEEDSDGHARWKRAFGNRKLCIRVQRKAGLQPWIFGNAASFVEDN